MSQPEKILQSKITFLPANYLPISRMPPLMIFHVAFSLEAQSTVVGADKRSLISMDSDMNLEILSLAESSTTSWEGATERLRTIMQMHVGP